MQKHNKTFYLKFNFYFIKLNFILRYKVEYRQLNYVIVRKANSSDSFK